MSSVTTKHQPFGSYNELTQLSVSHHILMKTNRKSEREDYGK